jgi:hypothetical protein
MNIRTRSAAVAISITDVTGAGATHPERTIEMANLKTPASAKTAEAHFRATAPKYMALLMQDFPMLDLLDAAAVFGNAGHESKGLTDDQEDAPVVRGSRGGANWMQWTGPRRRSLEAYCARNGLDPNSDEAAYKWLFLELKGAEKKAIPALLAADGLKAKVEAFEKAFLRAGVKHYPSRLRWAEIALDAFGDTSAAPRPVPRPSQIPAEPFPDVEPGRPAARPNWLQGAILLAFALAVGAWVWWTGQQAVPPSPLGAEIAPVPLNRPASLFGGPGSSLASEIGTAILMSFIGPVVSAVATYAVGWVVYMWGRVLKADFDKKSAEQLHAALERGILAAIDALGARANRASLLTRAVEYAETWNGGTVKRFGLTRSDLEELAAPHLAKAKRRG